MINKPVAVFSVTRQNYCFEHYNCDTFAILMFIGSQQAGYQYLSTKKLVSWCLFYCDIYHEDKITTKLY